MLFRELIVCFVVYGENEGPELWRVSCSVVCMLLCCEIDGELQVEALELLPLFFRLFRCPDKALRRLLSRHIIAGALLRIRAVPGVFVGERTALHVGRDMHAFGSSSWQSWKHRTAATAVAVQSADRCNCAAEFCVRLAKCHGSALQQASVCNHRVCPSAQT